MEEITSDLNKLQITKDEEQKGPQEKTEDQLKLSDIVYDTPIIQDCLKELDIKRWFKYVDHLTTFNRYCYSADIIKAKDWIYNTLKEIEGLEVSVTEFKVENKPLYNIIGTLHGSGDNNDIIIIGAHYDSTSEQKKSPPLGPWIMHLAQPP